MLARPDGRTSFLRHVVQTVPYYRALAKADRPDVSRLETFPLVSRSDLAERRLDFLSQALLTERGNLVAKTSGVTGEPLTVFLDLACWYDLSHCTFATVACNQPGLFSKFKPGRTGVVLITNEANRRQNSLILLAAKGALFKRRVIGRSHDADRKILKELRSKPIPILYGKPSYLDSLAALDSIADPDRGRIAPEAILVSGANLFSDTRARLERRYNCRVYDAYTSVEGGLIALECAHGTGLHVQSERVDLELLATDGTVRPTGTGEIVLTNRVNWAMPIVRYRTGDQATIAEGCACGHDGPTIVALPGREATLFETDRGAIVPQSLDRLLASADVKDYCLSQSGPDDFQLKWEPAGPETDVARRTAKLSAILRQKLGSASVEVSAVTAITRKGGKARRYVVAPNDESSRAGPSSGRQPSSSLQLKTGDQLCAIAYSPDGKTLASAGKDRLGRGSVVLWDLENVARLIDIAHTPERMRAVAFSLDGYGLAFAGDSGDIGIGDTRAGGAVRLVGAHRGAVLALAFAPNAALLASAGDDGLVRLWEVEDGTAARVLRGHRGSVCSLAFAPQGRILASASSDRTLRLWDVGDGTQLDRFRSSVALSAVAFSPDADTVAIGGWDGAVRLWDVGTGAVLATYHGHRGAVGALAFSPDAKSLASGGSDGIVKVWHFWTGDLLSTIEGHEDLVTGLGFAPDGTRLASASLDGVLRVSPIVSPLSP